MERNMFEPVFKDIFPFWDNISDGDKEYICLNSRAFTYPKGAAVHDGDECSGVIFVRSGCLRLYIKMCIRDSFLSRVYP